MSLFPSTLKPYIITPAFTRFKIEDIFWHFGGGTPFSYEDCTQQNMEHGP